MEQNIVNPENIIEIPLPTYTPEEQALNREAWFEALESGEYEQNDEKLRKASFYEGYSYCCLGVACEISKLGEWTNNNVYRVGDESNDVWLVSAVQNWLGLVSDTGEPSDYGYDGAADSLIQLNDSGWTFEQIAHQLRENEFGYY